MPLLLAQSTELLEYHICALASLVIHENRV